MSEWKEIAFEEIFKIPLRNGLTKPSKIRGSGLKMVNMKEIFSFDKISDNVYMELVPVEEKERNSLLEYDDLLFARQSLVESGAGKVAIFKGREETVFESHLIRCRINLNVCSPDFVYYYWKSPQGKGNMSTIVTQTAAAGIKGSVLQTLLIPNPPLPEQTAIASVLSSLDKKIDLLHRQNVTLEKMAETQFRNWFVEEPKEERDIIPLSQMANFLNGLACQNFPPKNEIEKLPVLKIKELSSGITANSDWASTDIKTEYIVRNGDIIFAWSASLMVKIWDGQDCILNQHLFKVTSEDYPKWFYYLWCKHHLAEFISIAASHATTMGHIKRGDLDEAKVSIPSPKELAAMTEQTEPLIQKIIANNIQINTLKKLRDSLLPKLMSGEVKVEI